MNTIFSRTALLLGQDAFNSLSTARVILFGVGGVGSWAAETLVRTGLGHITIVDFDTVSDSNINRQLPATTSTIGLPKVEVMRAHLLDINPDLDITAVNGLYTPETADDFNLDDFDYVIDAIDSLRDKALLINRATRSSCRLYSSMGAALKTDPTRLQVAEFWDAKGDRLAAALRRRFKKIGEYPARKFKVVFSPEIRENRLPSAHDSSSQPPTAPSPISKPTTNGSLMQVTAPAGIILASLVVNDIIANH